MDKKTLKELIETVAEIKELKPATSPTMRLDDTHQNDVRVGDEWVHINKDANPTLGFKIVKLKDKTRPCSLGCGLEVTNQLVESRIATHPYKHWRTRCDTCKKYVSPDGKGFVEGGGAHIQNAYTAYHIERKRKKLLGDMGVDIEQCENSVTDYNDSNKKSRWIVGRDGQITLRDSLGEKK